MTDLLLLHGVFLQAIQNFRIFLYVIENPLFHVLVFVEVLGQFELLDQLVDKRRFGR